MFKNLSALTTLVLFLLHTWLAVAASQKLLEDIRFEAPSNDEERITFKLNGTYIPKIFALKGEKPRVVFDFPDTKTARLLNNIINTNGKFIKRIRIGIHGEPHPKTRVVFDLIQDKDIDFTQNFDTRNNALIITVHYAGTKPSPPSVTRKDEKTPKPSVQSVPSAAPQKKVTAPAAQTPTAVQKKKKNPATQETKKISPPPTPAIKQASKPVVPAEPPPEQQTKTPEPEQASLAQPEKQKQAVPGRTTPKTSSGSAPLLSAITFDDSTNRGEMVLFKLNEFHPPIVFGVEEGLPRVVCDFKETAAADVLPSSIKTGGKYVQSIRIGKETSPKKIRVVLDLAPNNSYDLQQVFFKDDNLFVIIVNVLHNTPSAQELEKPLK